jgi:TP901 family phage tail tape measure protein
VSEDINLAALWVPVLAETSHLKGQLSQAGEEGAAIFGQAFLGSGIFKDIGRQLQGAITSGAPEGRRALDLLTAGHRDLSKAADDSAESASRASRVFNGIGIASVLAFGGAIAISAKAAGDFQASMTRLQASAGESAGNLQVVGDGILQLAGKVGYGAQDLANAMYTIEKAGYRGADGVNVLTAAAQGAKSENSDLTEVLSGLTTSMNDFNYTPDKAADVMSKMVAAVGMAKTNFQDFSGALHSVEPAAAAVGISLADVYGSLAQITQSGTSASQATDNMNTAIRMLSKPTQQMRDEMGQFGLNAVDVQEKLGQRGLAGTMQYLANTVRDHMDPAGQVVVDTMYKSQQATDSATQIFNALPPAAQAVAKSIQEGTLSYQDFRKTRGGLPQDQANELQQWVGLQNKIDGYSTALKTGQGSVQTYLQALSLMVGGQDAARIALQLTGENADKTNKGIQEIDQTTREHDGTVKGFNETQTTLNAKMDDFKAAMGAARIELGTAFLPALTDVAGALADVGKFLAEHEGLAEGLTLAVGGLGSAWLLLKGAMMGKELFDAVAAGFNLIMGTMDGTVAKVLSADAAFGGMGAAANTAATQVEGAAAREAGAVQSVTASTASADTALTGMGAAAEAGAGGVTAAAATEVTAVESVGTAATTAGLSLSSLISLGSSVGLLAFGTTQASDWFNNWAASHPEAERHDSQGRTPQDPGFNRHGREAGNHADGGIFATFASGGFSPMPKDAVIQPATPGLIQWAEPSTGGEAYIPLSGGTKSKSIWAQTGHLLGVFDQGGIRTAGSLGNATAGPQMPSLDTSGAQVDTIAVAEAVQQTFGINDIGMYRSPDGYNEHSSGEAADAMVGNDKELGNRVAQWALANAGQFGVEYVLWQQKQWNPDGSTSPMEDRGSPTQNHMDHVHIRTAGGGYPQGGGPGAAGAGSFPSGTSKTPAAAALGGWSGGAGAGASGGSGGGGGYGSGVQAGYYAADDQKVQAAQDRIDKLNGDIQVLQQKKSEETGKTKESEKTQIDNDLKSKNDELEKAKQDLASAQQGTFHADSRKGDNKTESQSEQFGSGFLKGAFSDLGFGNVLGGKSPLDWGIVKLLGVLAGWGIGEANGLADNAMGGGASALGGPLGGGAGGGMLSGLLQGATGLKIPGLGVPLSPSPVSASMANPNGSIRGLANGAAPGPNVYDNRIMVQGNTVADPTGFLPPIQAAQNARIGGANGSVSGSVPLATSP